MSFTVNVLSAKSILPSTHTATWDNENEADASVHKYERQSRGLPFHKRKYEKLSVQQSPGGH